MNRTPHLLQRGRNTTNAGERSGQAMPGGRGDNAKTQSKAQEVTRHATGAWDPTVSARSQKIRARVSPLMELRDQDVFEVLLMGNNMLPLVKRRSEFEQLSQQLERVQSGTPPLRINQQDPTRTAQDIQIFLDGLLLAIGVHEDSAPHCQLLKSFLGLGRSNDVDHFHTNTDGTVIRGKAPQRSAQWGAPANKSPSPRNALQSLHNQHLPQYPSQLPETQQTPLLQQGPASIDEKAVALERIRQRREAARVQKQTAIPSPLLVGGAPPAPMSPFMHMLSAEEKANLIRTKLAEALSESANLRSPYAHSEAAPHETRDEILTHIQSPEFSSTAYSAAMQMPDPGSSEKENAWGAQPLAAKSVNVRALRQAQVLLEQMDTTCKLKTWVNCNDEDVGLTFTQSLCGDSVFDIAAPKPVASEAQTVVTPRRMISNSGAPAPIESSSTTSNRVSAVAGYTSSFRDIRSKFANAVGSISDQEYASSLLTSQEPQPRTLESEDAFKPNREVFEYLVTVMKDGQEEVGTSTASPAAHKQTIGIRAGIVLCNLCLDSTQNRQMTVSAGAIDVLAEKLAQAVVEDDFTMQTVVAACFANIAAEKEYKDLIVESPAMQSLEQVLCGNDLQASSQAAGTLWSVCVDNTPQVKCTLASTDTLHALIKLLSVDDVEAQGRAAGTLSEICIKNAGIKTKIANAGAFLGLSKLVTTAGSNSYDITNQRLAACALCNLVANHPGNKRLAKRLCLVSDLASLLKHSEVMEIQNAAASCIFNVVCKTDKEDLEALEIMPLLRSIKSTARMIDTRLLCATNNPNEVASPAFGTF